MQTQCKLEAKDAEIAALHAQLSVPVSERTAQRGAAQNGPGLDPEGDATCRSRDYPSPYPSPVPSGVVPPSAAAVPTKALLPADSTAPEHFWESGRGAGAGVGFKRPMGKMGGMFEGIGKNMEENFGIKMAGGMFSGASKPP